MHQVDPNVLAKQNENLLPLLDMSTTNSSSSPIQQRYFKISKEDLFKGLVPPTLFETLSNNLAHTAASPLNTNFANI